VPYGKYLAVSSGTAHDGEGLQTVMTDDATITGKFRQFGLHSKPFWAGLSLVIMAIVGLLDYATGFELNFVAFYLIPVILAVWFVSRVFGLCISALCAVVSIVGDVIAGARYSSSLVPVWNTAIALTFYFVVVWIVSNLRSLHEEMEERVQRRTVALYNEMQERMRLEEEILSISEREQQRIGRDLHDTLGQHLTGTALAGEVLSEQLAAKSLPEAKAMGHIVEMVEGAIELTRQLARGLHPFELKGEGFTDALRELAVTVTEGLKIPCSFEYDGLVIISEPDVAIHLYRIAQEAINNSIKHSKASKIVMRLEDTDDGVTLTVTDDGVGVPEDRPVGKGLGLRTMAYRASVIGAMFNVERISPQGTRVVCHLPLHSTASPAHGTES
jgi:signal transduction histidine kinase